MKKQLVLTLYKNSRGAVIGDLYRDEKRLIATTHPATIAAAIFALDEYDFVFKSAKGEGEFEFPVATGELDTIASLLADQSEADFMSGFATFSRFDFAHPHPFDTQAEIHYRVAVHHLTPDLVKVAPAEPTPKSFKKELRNRNKYVYFPYC
jgi:hypothetical protein